MRDVTTANFGLLIAFVLPGFILLWGISPHSEIVTTWMSHADGGAPTVGGFLYVTIASVGLGQIVSTLRWLLIDPIHHRTGVEKPSWDFRQLRNNVAAFERLIDIHYRFYLWHANALVAVTLGVLLRWIAFGFQCSELLGLMVLDALLFVGSRDTLNKYYRRVDDLFRRLD